RELIRITRANIHSFLGASKFLPEAEQEHHEIGVAIGLVWTSTGGEVLYVEASLSKGCGNLTLTGQLGDVMKESAQAAVSYARAGIKTVIVPDRNKKDLDEIPKPLRRKLHWVIAENMSDVLQIALLDRQNGARKTKHVSAPKTKSRKGKSLKRERSLRKNHRER